MPNTITKYPTELSKFLRSVMEEAQKKEFSVIYSETVDSKKFEVKVQALARKDAIKEFIRLFGYEYVIWDVL